MTKEPKEFLYA
ncbi:hypothetical protein CGLO_14761 [Colletotrichum gloeosporioides Cg-14]|uniref:Uncharacterized protein n=1 Tax=Colletotrichum gloeosporioides (strain Cg-14) TaxID=1237896 RepID=T0K371_COLGC|nr:hypothetical protein CGLO_14761 [Colletotrichum gloeosporioides Cg-14]